MGARRLRKGKESWGMAVCQSSMRERRRRGLVVEGGMKHGQGGEESVGA